MGPVRIGDYSKNDYEEETHEVYRNLWVVRTRNTSDSSLCITTSYALFDEEDNRNRGFMLFFFKFVN